MPIYFSTPLFNCCFSFLIGYYDIGTCWHEETDEEMVLGCHALMYLCLLAMQSNHGSMDRDG